MNSNPATKLKVGLLVFVALAILAYLTIEVSNMSLTPGGTYTLYTTLENAEGITKKTPVQIAGIQVGVVSSIKLLKNHQAQIGLKIQDDVKVTEDMSLQVRSRGVLGDVYLELVPGKLEGPAIEEGGALPQVGRSGDYQNIVNNASQISEDLKEITAALKEYTVSEQSRVAKTLKNMEILTANLAEFSTQNASNMNAIVENLAALSADLRRISHESGADVEEALSRIAAITKRVDEGEGTVGRLLNDEATIDKANRVLDNLEDITHTYFSFKTELGYHLEYLGRAGTAKNYVNIKLKPRPDKFFTFGVVHNPNPPGSSSFETEIFDTDGVTTTVEKETVEFKKIRFNAQLGKSFSDFTVRGGLIESTGGVGVDYTKGPVTLRTDAYNFGDSNVHLKAMAELNLTNSIFVLGGVDDITSRDSGVDYFFGAGLRFTDEDINSLFGGASLLLAR